MLTVGVKMLRCVSPGKTGILYLFVVLFELTSIQRAGEASDKRAWTENRKLQVFLILAQTSAPGLKT